MIEAPVPEDVRKYQGKIIGPFNKRQVIFIGIALALDSLIIKITGFSIKNEAFVYLIALIDVPILLFAFDINGEPMEKYLWNTLIKNLIQPRKRTIKNTINPKEVKEIKDEEEIMEIGFQKSKTPDNNIEQVKVKPKREKKKTVSAKELKRKIKENPNLEEFY